MAHLEVTIDMQYSSYPPSSGQRCFMDTSCHKRRPFYNSWEYNTQIGFPETLCPTSSVLVLLLNHIWGSIMTDDTLPCRKTKWSAGNAESPKVRADDTAAGLRPRLYGTLPLAATLNSARIIRMPNGRFYLIRAKPAVFHESMTK